MNFAQIKSGVDSLRHRNIDCFILLTLLQDAIDFELTFTATCCCAGFISHGVNACRAIINGRMDSIGIYIVTDTYDHERATSSILMLMIIIVINQVNKILTVRQSALFSHGNHDRFRYPSGTKTKE
jgi:hypothetical protein